MFLPGCNWLVCDIENEESKGIKHIYVREVNLGLNEQKVVFWLDEKLLRNSYSSFHFWIND